MIAATDTSPGAVLLGLVVWVLVGLIVMGDGKNKRGNYLLGLGMLFVAAVVVRSMQIDFETVFGQ